jgi:hypothetical protein
MHIFKRRKLLKNINSMDLIPVRRHEHQTDDSGKVKLVVPKFEKAWMRRFFISGHRKDHFTISLDEMGSEIWLEIDGKATVKELCDRIRQKHENPLDELEERTVKFISVLYEQRYITFRQLLEAENARS